MYNDKIHSYKHSVSIICQYSTVTEITASNGAKMTFSRAFHKCNQTRYCVCFPSVWHIQRIYWCLHGWSGSQDASRCHIGCWHSQSFTMNFTSSTNENFHLHLQQWPQGKKKQDILHHWCLLGIWFFFPAVWGTGSGLLLHSRMGVESWFFMMNVFDWQKNPPHCTQMERLQTSSRGN